MRAFFNFLFFGITFFSYTDYAIADEIHPFHAVIENMRYRGGSAACNNALQSQRFTEKITYFLIPKIFWGSGEVEINNPTSAMPPVMATLDQDGDNDRFGFTHYYDPDHAIWIHHEKLGLYAVIFNLCPNSSNDMQKQAALVIDLPSGKQCLVSTPIWNYCR